MTGDVALRVREALAHCGEAGIRVVMVTGDYGLTARAIAEHLALPVERVVSGTELDRMSPDTLRAMLAAVRTKMGRCADRDPGTDVMTMRDLRGPRREISGWRVRSEIDNKHSVTYFMGVVRVGTAVAQVGFVPSGHAALAPGDFVRLLDRAAERLRWLPRPG